MRVQSSRLSSPGRPVNFSVVRDERRGALNDLPAFQSGLVRNHHRGGVGGRPAKPGAGWSDRVASARFHLGHHLALRDTADVERIAAQLEATFWFVLPSLPMFLVLPATLRHGFGFWPALALSCLLTMGLYSFMIWALARFGIQL